MELYLLLFITLAILASAGYGFFTLLQIQETNPFTAMFFGMFSIALFAYGANFFFPLQGVGILFCLIPAFLGSLEIKNHLGSWFSHKTNARYTQSLCCLLLPLLVLASVSTLPVGDAYDTDLYHFQIIQWAQEFAIVPGLGNLHSRLANGSAWYMLSALVPLELAKTPTFMTALFFTISLGWIGSHLFTVRNLWEKAFFISLAPLCFFYMTKWKAYPSLYIDSISLFTFLLVVYELLSLWLSIHKNTYASCTRILTLLALGFAIKPLVAIPLFLGILLCFALYYKKEISFTSLCKALAFPALLGILWILRNVILTGYPVFPTTLLALPVDWIVDKVAVDGNRLAVMGWARWPRAGYQVALESGMGYWFPTWLAGFLRSKTHWMTFIFPLGIACALWAMVCYKNCKAYILYTCVFCLLPIIYWFFMYPDTRFGTEFVWGFLASACALLVVKVQALPIILQITPFINKHFQKISFALCIAFFIFLTSQVSLRTLPLTWEAHLWPSLPVQQIQHAQEMPNETFSLWIPAQGSDQCGLAPLPCGFATPQLRMRDPKNMEKGFYRKLENEHSTEE